MIGPGPLVRDRFTVSNLPGEASLSHELRMPVLPVCWLRMVESSSIIVPDQANFTVSSIGVVVTKVMPNLVVS